MAISAFSGPVFSFGQNPYSPNEYNPDVGSSLFFAGTGIMDPRTAFTYLPGQSQSTDTFGWYGGDNITTSTIVPYSASATAIVASANPTSANLTVVSANSATTGVYYSTNFVRSDTGATDTVLALDAYVSVTASFSNGVMTVTANSGMPIGPGMVVLSTSGTVSQGTAAGTQVFNQLTTTGGTATAPVAQGYAGTYQTLGNLTATSGTVTLAYQNVQQCVALNNPQTPSVALWNPMALTGRCVTVTAAAGATYTTATVNGYDVYGFPMSEAITLTAGSAVNGNKAFKYIKSVVLSGGTADTTHAYSVGTRDVFGLPIRADSFGEVTINSATSLTAVTGITAATGFIIADRTTPSATTGDVRGTYAFTSSTATNKLIIRQSPQPYNAQSATGLFGLTQYYNF